MRHGGGGKPFIFWVLARFESLCASKNSLQSSLKFVLQSSKNQIFVVLNLFQHLTSLEDLLAFNKILNSLKITDKSPYFLRFQNDTKIILDFNSSPNEERICGQTTQLVANSDIPPQRGSGFADGRCNLLQVRIARKLSKLEPQVQLRNFTSVEQIQDRLGGVQYKIVPPLTPPTGGECP